MNGSELSRVLGVSEATVSRLASGAREPGIDLIWSIKQALKWNCDQQIGHLRAGTYGPEFKKRMAARKPPASATRGAKADTVVVDDVMCLPGAHLNPHRGCILRGTEPELDEMVH